jgi:dimethylhistidine N-methyltransferase
MAPTTVERTRSPRWAPDETTRETPGDEEREAFAREVRRGLLRSHKRVSCRFLYDAEGSRLFERICDLPEYYLTRAELEILQGTADEIAALVPRATLVELGSGSARKTELLIDAFLAAGRDDRLDYAPIDVSRAALIDSAARLMARYPTLQLHPQAQTYQTGLAHLARDRGVEPWLVLWLGSSIGNLTRSQAAQFLASVRRRLRPGDRVLFGVDLRKDRAILEAAYDDPEGVTALFNKNLLARINRDLGGQFDLDAFAHRARYQDGPGRVELHLVSRSSQRVPIAALGAHATFAAGEGIFTERSVKYSIGEIHALARAAGLAVARLWFDGRRRYALTLLA